MGTVRNAPGCAGHDNMRTRQGFCGRQDGEERTSCLVHAPREVLADVGAVLHELLPAPPDTVAAHVAVHIAAVLRLKEQERVAERVSIPAHSRRIVRDNAMYTDRTILNRSMVNPREKNQL